MTQASTRLGRIGEQIAVRHLERRGLQVVARNWRTACDGLRGEIDVVARDGEALVFCEVKTLRSAPDGAALEAIDWAKRRQLRRLASLYLAEQPATGTFRDVRFDVVAVTWPAGGGAAVVDHRPGAF